MLVTWWLALDRWADRRSRVPGWRWRCRPRPSDESTFLWNPNLIALSSADRPGRCLGARGRPSRPRVVAAGRAWGPPSRCSATSSASTLLPIVGALLVADARSRPAGPGTPVGLALWAGSASRSSRSASSPLVVHELTTGFSRSAAALDYLRVAAARPASTGADRRGCVVTGIRVVSWPAERAAHRRPRRRPLVATVAVVAIAVGCAACRCLCESGRRPAGSAWDCRGRPCFLTFASPSPRHRRARSA